ncbi:unnamed protein product [Chrysoparadoxa australica]
MSAFVEIVFDNSDQRMAADGDEVVLRRTIGLKKDEFFLNRKKITKLEVSALLESAGFSKSNPYYIVQQGKVALLTTMKDDERLNLLKEVAGTQVYEERKKESERIMDETSNRREKIQEVITYIEERLAELEEEKEELGEYQQLDRDRRALEYTLYNKELQNARDTLESIEESRAADTDRTNELHESLRQDREGLASGEKELTAREARTAKLEVSKEKIEAERIEAIGRRTQLELEVKDTNERVDADGESQEQLQQELQKLNRVIDEKEASFERRVDPAYKAAQEAVRNTESRIAELTALADELYAKQSRHSQFRSAAERDAFLKQEIASIKGSAQDKQANVAKLEATIQGLERQVHDHSARTSEIESDIKQRHELIAGFTAELAEKTSARNDLAEERKDRWRQLEQLTDSIAELKMTLQKSERELKSSMPRNVASGLEAVERFAKGKVPGYHGPVIENFSYNDDKFVRAVEVAAGNSLFHVIVDTDSTAARLMKRLEDGNLGRLTFMPLNRLKAKQFNYPESNDVVPLIDVALTFKPEVKAAMSQASFTIYIYICKYIFGKKLIARTLEVAGQFSESTGMDAITLEGDEVNGRGGLHGGYHDGKISRLTAMKRIRSCRKELAASLKEQQALKVKSKEVDQAVTNLMGEIQKIETKRTTARHIIDQSGTELAMGKRDQQQVEASLARSREMLPVLRSEAHQEELRAEMLEKELGTELQSSMSLEDLQELTDLNKNQLPAANAQLKTEFEALASAAQERQGLSALLKDNLLVRRDELLGMLDPEHGGVGASSRTSRAQERQEELVKKKEELKQVVKTLEDNRSTLAKVEQELLDGKQQNRQLLDEMDQLRTRERETSEALAEAWKVGERLINKRALALQKRETNMRKIQELGSLPAQELVAHASLSMKNLMRKLHKVNEKLKKYSHVNKKALDQYVNFSDQRKELLDRKKELDEGAKAIQELIAALDRQKDEAIMRTFRDVSRHFEEVFKELVPAGKGSLIMKKGKGPGGEGPESESAAIATEGEEEEAEPRYDVGKFSGVQVVVSFGSGETFLMSQLSGGQKALVALALIFAIQRCDPAPFYLFDEIDQALDSSYRASVAALIQRQCHSANNPTQFITTTFRPELVSVANRCYGISHQNKVSNIHELTKEEALGFVASILSEEEAVGEQLHMPTATSTSKPSKSKSGSKGKGKSKSTPAPMEPESEQEDEEEEEASGRAKKGVKRRRK